MLTFVKMDTVLAQSNWRQQCGFGPLRHQHFECEWYGNSIILLSPLTATSSALISAQIAQIFVDNRAMINMIIARNERTVLCTSVMLAVIRLTLILTSRLYNSVLTTCIHYSADSGTVKSDL